MLRFTTLALLTLSLIGCGGKYDSAISSSYEQDANSGFASDKSDYPLSGETEKPGEFKSAETGKQRVTKTALGAEEVDTHQDAKRKIIYTANLTLVVEKLSDTETQVKALTDQYKGYISKSRHGKTTGDLSHANWVIRIPVGNFASYLEKVEGLGVPESRQTDAQDVTEEFVDITARLKNKRLLETRVKKLLDEQTGELKDVISVERELSRVREEIERFEGRIRYLTDQTDLTTVTIFAREEHNYKPPVAKTFGNRISSAFSLSISNLSDFCQDLVVMLVAIAPWLAMLALVLILLLTPIILISRRRRNARA